MEDSRCKVTATRMENPRYKSLITGVVIEVEDPRYRSLYCHVTIEREDPRCKNTAMEMEDPRCKIRNRAW